MDDTDSRLFSSGPFLSAAHEAALNAIVHAARTGQTGIVLTGSQGSGRSTLLAQASAALQHDEIVWASLAPGASPADVETLLSNAKVQSGKVGGRGRILVVLDDADRARRDTLDLLDSMTALLRGNDNRVQLLLAARSNFLARLVTNDSRTLLAYLEVRLALPSPAGDSPAPMPEAASIPVSNMRSAADWTDDGATLNDSTQWDNDPAISAAPALSQEDIRRVSQGPSRQQSSSRPVVSAVAGVALAVAAFVAWLQIVPRPGPASPNTASSLSGSFTSSPEVPAISQPIPAPGADEPSGNGPENNGGSPSPSRIAPVQSPQTAARNAQVLDAEPTPGTANGSQATGELGELGRPSGPGLLLVARQGDTLRRLYQKLYVGLKAPPFAEILAINPGPVRPGSLLVFPTPPGGWQAK